MASRDRSPRVVLRPNPPPASQVNPTDHDLFKLKHLVAAPLPPYKEAIEELSNCAVKEGEVERKLLGVKNEWAYASFRFVKYSVHKSVQVRIPPPTDRDTRYRRGLKPQSRRPDGLLRSRF